MAWASLGEVLAGAVSQQTGHGLPQGVQEGQGHQNGPAHLGAQIAKLEGA